MITGILIGLGIAILIAVIVYIYVIAKWGGLF